MSDIMIKVEGLGKRYTITHEQPRGYTALRDVISNKIKGLVKNKKSNFTAKEDFWALKDVNFEIKRGDAVGIIGRNGAGKSTLLKILSRITEPTHGRIELNGRVASLLEVGTGFHPELTGRENIFLNGAILGMSRAEIKRKFDEIVDFSGVEKFLDTPVKRYSSGMYVRLAFAVAAHLEPEILVVDEVLAVGDTEFQKKCLGKMDDVTKEGRTLLFVSHNIAAVQKLCDKVMFLNKGSINVFGDKLIGINSYLNESTIIKSIYEFLPPLNYTESLGYVYKVQIENDNNDIVTELPKGKLWQTRIFFKINKKVEHFIIGLGLSSSADVSIKTTWSNEIDINPGNYEAVFKENELQLASGIYNIVVGLSSYERTFQYLDNTIKLVISEASDEALDGSVIKSGSNTGLILNPMSIKINYLN